MAKPYDYNCKCKYDNTNGYKGRMSETFFNGELHNVFETVRHLSDYPSKKEITPVAKYRGALWLDQRTNQLYSWVGLGYKHDRVRNGWLPIFTDKFQLIDEITNDLPSAKPVIGQLWLCNECLLYYNGSSWQPVKTLEHSDTQLNISLFSDYTIISPLAKTGSTVISDQELSTFLELQKRYLQNDIDIMNQADAGIEKRWNWDLEKKSNVLDFNLDDIFYQYLVPSIRTGRVFLDDKLDKNYTVQNDNVIQYKRSYLINEQPNYDDNTPLIAHVKTPSLIHVNPGKLCKITKRLFKVNRINPKICCSAKNTEYYGFITGDIHGHFLIPGQNVDQITDEHRQKVEDNILEHKQALFKELKEQGYDISNVQNDNYFLGDYETLSDGIFLSYNASQTYDYILAVTFDFSWISATGQLRQGDDRTGSCSFYVPNHLGSTNIFINGFDYESNYYSWDSKNRVVTVAEDISDKSKFDISVLGVFKHEYGWIRATNISTEDCKAYISTVQQFQHPLIFVNGEVLLRSQWNYYDPISMTETGKPGTSFSILNVKQDMCWTIIDMCSDIPVYNEAGKQTGIETFDICIEDNGYIPYQNFIVDIKNNPAIPIPDHFNIAYEDLPKETLYKLPRVVLFVNGLMVRREDVRYDIRNNVITCEGLSCGMHYVLLDDSQGNLYTEEMANGIKPAISVGQIDASLVYHDGYLLNEKSSYLCEAEEGYAAASAVHGEIRAFNLETSWKWFDATKQTEDSKGIWCDLDEQDIANIKSFSNSYVNGNTAIALTDESLNIESDSLTVFGYKLAGNMEHSTVPVTCWLHLNDQGTQFLKEAGYSEAYAKIIKYEKTNAVYLNKIDPVNKDLISDYIEKKYDYYYFLIRAFNLWKRDKGLEQTSRTSESLIAEYQHDARKHPDELTDILHGYFYDEVYMETKSDEDNYIKLKNVAFGLPWVNKIFIGKDFSPVSDYVMVWINGVRQYPDINYVISPVYENEIFKGYNLVLGHIDGDSVVETVDTNGYIQINETESYPLTGILTYIIQRAENGNEKVCSYKVLNSDNMIDGSQNVYTTKVRQTINEETVIQDIDNNFSLYPGKVTVYADGVRLPKSAYTVVDNYTIIINDIYPWRGGSRYPEEPYLDCHGNLRTIHHKRPEEILVEVRQNSSWTERTIKLPKNFSGDIDLFTAGSQIPQTILDTQDTIMIFINGLYHGLTANDGYVIDKTAGILSIRDNSVLSAIKKDDLENFIGTNPTVGTLHEEEIKIYREQQEQKLCQVILEWR